MIYTKTIVPGLNRFYRGHLQNTPNIKIFFGYASLNMNGNSENFLRLSLSGAKYYHVTSLAHRIMGLQADSLTKRLAILCSY